MNPDPALTSPGALARQVTELWRQQAADWTMLAEGIAGLRQSRTRSFRVGGSRVEVQSNPARFKSTSAKVDPASISQRPCFLCPDHLPDAQQAIAYRGNWLILCNPAPIFEPHFTIATTAHQPQRVIPAIRTMLDLTRDLDGVYTVFYNGPFSGASAPDHLHLQATPAGVMPFETELAAELCTESSLGESRWIEWLADGPVHIGTTRARRRPAVVLVSESQESLAEALERVIGLVGEVRPAEPEPMLNLFAAYAEGRWISWLFPRAAHRPGVYGHGPDDYLISPGGVDLAGVLIAPRPGDCDRLEAATIESILGEVLLSPGAFARLRGRLVDQTPA